MVHKCGQACFAYCRDSISKAVVKKTSVDQFGFVCRSMCDVGEANKVCRTSGLSPEIGSRRAVNYFLITHQLNPVFINSRYCHAFWTSIDEILAERTKAD